MSRTDSSTLQPTYLNRLAALLVTVLVSAFTAAVVAGTADRRPVDPTSSTETATPWRWRWPWSWTWRWSWEFKVVVRVPEPKQKSIEA